MERILIKELKNIAIESGLCNEHQLAWDYNSLENILNYYKTNANWCMERNYPSLDYITNKFDNEILLNTDIFINKNFDTESPLYCDNPIYIFHNCSGFIHISFNREKKNYPIIYVGNNSNIHITIDGCNSPIHVFDTSKISIDVKERSKAFVIRYNNNTVTFKDQDLNKGLIKIRDKNGSV